MGEPGFALYVHVPFCTVKCGYCDFNAYAGMDALKGDYTEALLSELRSWAPLLPDSPLTSIGFGGGTPGEFAAAGIARVVKLARSLRTPVPDAEVSLEANPGTSVRRDLMAFREAGVTRITFGAQSFHARELKFLDRIHSPEAIVASVANAREVGFRSVGLDLIYGLPGQTGTAWRSSLSRAIALSPDHISCYALTLEPATLLAARVSRGEVEMPEPDFVAELYEMTSDVLGSAGYRQYEISNWARAGHESRHNMTYWTDRPYIGIGAGAHGFVGGVRYENVAHPKAYVNASRALKVRVEAELRPGGTVAAVQAPPKAAAMVDFIALRLRLTRGLEARDFAARFGCDLMSVAGSVLEEAARAQLLHFDAGRVALTRQGRLLHGEITVRLMAALEDADES